MFVEVARNVCKLTERLLCLSAGQDAATVHLQQQDLSASRLAASLVQLSVHLQGMMQPASWARCGRNRPQRQR